MTISEVKKMISCIVHYLFFYQWIAVHMKLCFTSSLCMHCITGNKPLSLSLSLSHLNTWIYFLPEEYTPLCKLTKSMFSLLENVFYLMNIHLCASWLKWSWILPLTYTWALWVEWWGITKCPLFMAVQVDKN